MTLDNKANPKAFFAQATLILKPRQINVTPSLVRRNFLFKEPRNFCMKFNAL